MENKAIIVILILLIIISGSIGYYTYSLNQQIDSLAQRLIVSEAHQEARIRIVRDEIVELSEESSSGIDSLKEHIEESQDYIAELENDLDATEERVISAEVEIDAVISQVSQLDNRIEGAESNISQSVIDVSEVYKEVSQATVRITDGQNTIGSGFIYDIEGYVVTAFHVIDGLSPIYLVMDDGRISEAVIVGYSQISDVAVLKLDDNPRIMPVSIGDSSKIEIGEPVIAIGSPLDMRDTLTAGVISQVNRFTNYGTDTNWVSSLIQFDAPVNPGNSGGPLINKHGEIIGLIVARISTNQGDGIYYAVSANKVKRITEAIIDIGTFLYPWIGILPTDLTPQLVEEMSLETTNGVLISGVIINSPAETAGLLTSDVVVAMDGIPIRDSGELTSFLGELINPGDISVLDIIRDKTRIQIPIVVGIREI